MKRVADQEVIEGPSGFLGELVTIVILFIAVTVIRAEAAVHSPMSPALRVLRLPELIGDTSRPLPPLANDNPAGFDDEVAEDLFPQLAGEFEEVVELLEAYHDDVVVSNVLTSASSPHASKFWSCSRLCWHN